MMKCIEATHSPELAFLFQVGDLVSNEGVTRDEKVVLKHEGLADKLKGNSHFVDEEVK